MLGIALCLRCITVLEPWSCRELPLSENSHTSNQWSLLIGLCTGCISVLLWLIASIFGFLQLTCRYRNTQTLFWITNMMLAVPSWLGYLAWNLCSFGVFRYHCGADGGFETLSRWIWFISQRIPDLVKVPLLRCANWWGYVYVTLPSAQSWRRH